MKINEKVKVLTLFEHNPIHIRPLRVKWQGKIHVIIKIGFHHKEKRGRVLFHIFSVMTSTLFLRLSFDTEHLEWTLEEVTDGIEA